MVFQFTPLHLTLALKGQIRSLGTNLDVYHRQLDIISVAWTIRQRNCQAERPLVVDSCSKQVIPLNFTGSG